jgi:hypothetical protein
MFRSEHLARTERKETGHPKMRESSLAVGDNPRLESKGMFLLEHLRL